MFGHLTEIAAQAEEAKALSADDYEIARLVDSLENWNPLPTDIAELQSVENDVEQLEHYAEVVREHGSNEALVAFADKDGELSGTLDVAAISLESMSTAQIDKRVVAVKDMVGNVDEDDEAHELTGSSEDVFTAFVVGYAVTVVVLFVIAALSATMQSFSQLYANAWRNNIRAISDAINARSWSKDRAKDNAMKAMPFKNLRQEIAAAVSVVDVLRAIWMDGKMPVTKEEYEKWANSLNQKLAPFSKVYGVSVEKKGWFIKTPKVVASKPKNAEIVLSTVDKLGYNEGSLAELVKSADDIARTVSNGYKVINAQLLAMEAEKVAIEQKKIGFFAKIKERHYVLKAYKLGAKLTRVIAKQGVTDHTMPAISSAARQVAKCYDKRKLTD